MEVSSGRMAAVRAPTPDETDVDSLRGAALTGALGEVVEAVAAYRLAAGDGLHFGARAYLPGLPHEVHLEALRLNARVVSPAIRELVGAAGATQS